MNFKDLKEDDTFEGVLLETFRPKGASRPRVRPVSELPNDILVEFPRNLRTEHPIGTRFRSNVKVCQKHNQDGSLRGKKYLSADNNTIKLVRKYHPIGNIYAIQIGDRSFEYIKSTSKIEEQINRLREIAYDVANESPRRRKHETSSYERKGIIKLYALERSNGICEACESEAPFINQNGKPYLEVHHIKALAEGGTDHPENVAAICPNCHRRIDHGIDGNKVNDNLGEAISLKESKLSQKNSVTSSPESNPH